MPRLNLSEPEDPSRAQDGRNTRHEGRRRELMDEALAYVLSHGLSDLSIRPMAEAMGISHRTLLHHFGSKEGLVERVLAEVRTRYLQGLHQQAQRKNYDVLAMMDDAWAQTSRPDRLPFWRSFFEIYAIATKTPERHPEFLESIINAWLPNWIEAMVAQGVPRPRAEALSTMTHASCRGLVIDLLTTGDQARVARAYKLLRQVLQQELERSGYKAAAKQARRRKS
jgi:AcrR family transcriptional regulator